MLIGTAIHWDGTKYFVWEEVAAGKSYYGLSKSQDDPPYCAYSGIGGMLVAKGINSKKFRRLP
jgi:hypothetical protein